MSPRPLWVLAAALVPAPAAACSLCDGLFTGQTMRREAAAARLVLVGTLANPRLDGTGGRTDLRIDSVLKDDPVRANRPVIELPRWVPVGPDKPPRWLVVCDVYDGRIDPVRSYTVKTDAVLAYLRGAMALDESDRDRVLRYAFDHLASADEDVAADAFLEFARASDAEVARVAKALDPARVRKLVADPATPPVRLGLYAYLLGACGGPADADLLRKLIDGVAEPTRPALSGLLGGYARLKPAEGWALTRAVLNDAKRAFPERMAALNTARFFHGCDPDGSRRPILDAYRVAIEQGDLSDLAVEDLRRWKWWELTPTVLAQYGKPSHGSPLVRRALVRYALSCPRPEAARFLDGRRRAEPELVKDVAEALEFEK